jgi:hypothetical protein
VFERRSCGNGTKGPRYSDWALIATTCPREFLLIRRLPSREKNQYTFYLCWAPEGRPATMTYFITIAGRRWPVEVTFKTGKDTLAWDTSQARAYDAICRHTALTALAQLRTTAIRAAISGPSAVPVTGPDTAAACQGTAAPSGENTVSAAGLQFYRHGAPLPSSGGQPCPPSPASPRSGCPTPRPPASTASPATGKPGSSPPPASPSISAGQHGAGSTRPAPAGTTTAPASRPSPPNLRRTKGSDTV